MVFHCVKIAKLFFTAWEVSWPISKTQMWRRFGTKAIGTSLETVRITEFLGMPLRAASNFWVAQKHLVKTHRPLKLFRQKNLHKSN